MNGEISDEEIPAGEEPEAEDYASNTKIEKLLSQFKGKLPYDSQYIGIYSPLLGWTSKLTKNWFFGKISKIYDKVKDDITATAYRSFKLKITNPHPKTNLPRLSSDSKYRWLRNINVKKSELYGDLLTKKLGIADLADKAIKEFNNVADEKKKESKKAFEPYAIATILNYCKANNINTQYINYGIAQAHHWEDRLKMADLLEQSLFKREEKYIVSPIGIMDLYKNYYFDFGSILGKPIQHLYIFPKSKTEFVEKYSRTSYSFSESEFSIESTEREEKFSSESEEYSTEIQKQFETDINTGVSVEGGLNVGVYHASGTASFDFGLHMSRSKKEARKKSREISNKTIKEIKSKKRFLTKKSLETKKENIRRHVINNDTDELMNFELCRKNLVVGVQVKHLGTQLAWQIYIDDPGKNIGLAELIHIAKPEDFNTSAPPDLAPPTFENSETDYVFQIPFDPTTEDYDDNGDYIDGKNGGDRIKKRFNYETASPQPGYKIKAVTELHIEKTDPDHDPPSLWSIRYSPKGDGKFEAYLDEVNFEKQPAVRVTVRLLWGPTDKTMEEAQKEYEENVNKYEKQQQQKAQEILIDALRERINLVRSVTPRDSWDLREEERKIICRKVIQRLMGHVDESQYHVTSEILSSMFELDKLLYFVASDWWNPRFQGINKGITYPELPDKTLMLGPSNRVSHGGVRSKRANNYLITEESEPAPLGSSLGWLVQIDADKHRNAFLNSSWVKVVVPIRRGKENHVIDWLKNEMIEGEEDLDVLYLDENKKKVQKLDENGDPIPNKFKTIEDMLREFIETLTSNLSENEIFLQEQKVFETGFDPLEAGFQIDKNAFQKCAQWIEIIPTDQIVPKKFKI
jgi:hypothetical protein